MDILELIGRTTPLFDVDVSSRQKELKDLVSSSSFLVIGGAGSIGQAVTREIFKRNPLSLHVVDISENNMVELVRDIRSTLGYIDGDFRTYALDCGSNEYHAARHAARYVCPIAGEPKSFWNGDHQLVAKRWLELQLVGCTGRSRSCDA